MSIKRVLPLGIIITSFLFPKFAYAGPTFLLFGSRGFGKTGHDVFLGCINCNKNDADAISNEYGTYGSRFSALSIYNQFGAYGSRFSNTSPCNPYGSNPPVIVDTDGNFYAYLTLNKYLGKESFNPQRIGTCLSD